MCNEYGIIIGEQLQASGPPIECDKKPPGATARDCPNYRFLLVASDHWTTPFSSSPSVQIGGGTGVGRIGTDIRNGGDTLAFCSGKSGGKHTTGGNDQAFSAGRAFPSCKSGESGGRKGTGDGQDTGGSSTAAAASGRKLT